MPRKREPEDADFMSCADCRADMWLVDGYLVCSKGCGGLLIPPTGFKARHPELRVELRPLDEAARALRGT